MSTMNLNNVLPQGIYLCSTQGFDSSKISGNGAVSLPTYLRSEVRTEHVKIYINKEFQKYFPIFSTGNTEQVLQLIQCHEGIFSAMELVSKHDAMTHSLAGKRAALALLNADADTRWETVLDIEDIIITLANLPVEAYDLMEQLLD